MSKDLPIFDIIVDDEDLKQGVGRISLVDEPAIGVDWIALRKQPKMVMAKRVCLGCPPNGDGTRANGEPDRRCRDTKKGEGGAGNVSGKGTNGGSLSDKIKSSEAKIETTKEETDKILKAMTDMKETKNWSRDGRTVTVKRDYQMENWTSAGGGKSNGWLVSNWSYTATDGIPDMGGQGGKYFNGTVIGTVTKNPDGTRVYNFNNPDEKKRFFDRLGL